MKPEHPLLPEIKRLRAAGVSMSEIGRRLGKSKNAIVGLAKRNGLSNPANSPIRGPRAPNPAKTNDRWSSEEERQLLAFLEAGAEAAVVTAALRRTGRAIAAHMQRLRLRGVAVDPRAASRFTAPAHGPAPEARQSTAVQLPPSSDGGSPGCERAANSPAAPPAPALPQATQPKAARAAFSGPHAKSGGRCCQWPIGTPRTPGFRFCEAALDAGTTGPYCPEHHARAYVRAAVWSEEQREAARARYIARMQARRRANMGVAG